MASQGDSSVNNSRSQAVDAPIPASTPVPPAPAAPVLPAPLLQPPCPPQFLDAPPELNPDIQHHEMRIEQLNSVAALNLAAPSANFSARGKKPFIPSNSGRSSGFRGFGHGRGRGNQGRIVCQLCNKPGHPDGNGATIHITDNANNIQAPAEYKGKTRLIVDHATDVMIDDGAPCSTSQQDNFSSHSPITQHHNSPGLANQATPGSVNSYSTIPLHGIVFKPSKDWTIECFSDADWAGSIDDRKSTTGYCVFLGGNLITWCSKNQKVVAKSSIEVEYRALSQTAIEVA
uniref:Mitochondrial protein n=1 Tax=Cannabis sativa TaxID=3483 RepID=A0A803Q4P8_CANSA